MNFERLHNVQNGVRYFDTATSSTVYYQWTEGGATYFSVRGCGDITQYALKINPDDTISFGSGGSFVTIGTEQTITAMKTFTGGLKLTNLPGYVAYPPRYPDVLSLGADGTVRTATIDLTDSVTLSDTQTITGIKTFESDVYFSNLPGVTIYPPKYTNVVRLGAGGKAYTVTIDLTDSVTLSETQTITGGKTFSSANMFFSGLLTTITTGYTGNLMAIDGSGRPTKISASSLVVNGNFVTLDTTQVISGGKSFSSAEMYFSGLELESTPTTGGFAIIRGNKVRYCPWSTVSGLISGGGNFVTVDTTQTISGTKTFSASTINAPNLNLYFSTQSPDYLVGFINDGFYKVQSSWFVTKDKVQSITGHKTFSEVTITKLYTMGQMTNPQYFLTIDGSGAIYWAYAPTGGGNYVTTDTIQTITGIKTFTQAAFFYASIYWGPSGGADQGRLWGDGDAEFKYAVNHPTTSPVNAHLTASGYLRVSTAGSSTIRIKKDVEDILPERYSLIHKLRPVWHRYSILTDTPSEWGWYALIAEEVAELVPQLVHYDYDKEDYEDAEGTKKGTKLRSGATRKPVGIRYDRLAVLMLPELQNLRKENDELRKKVDELSAIVTKISSMLQ